MDKFVPFTSEFTARHIALSVPDAMLIALAIFIVLRLFCFKRMKASRTILCGVFAAYIGAVAALTLFPIIYAQFTFSAERFGYVWSTVKTLPFVWSVNMIQNGLLADNMQTVFYNLGGYLIMLMPFGFLVPMIWHPRTPKMILLCILVPFCIELLQLVENALSIGYNDVSFDDFFLNATGCILAYLLYLGIRTAIKKGR